MSDIFCPICGHSLLLIASGEIDPKNIGDERMFRRKILLESDEFKNFYEEKKTETYVRSIYLNYLVCIPCKHLYAEYSRSGIHFDILGNLSNDAIACLAASVISKKD